MDEKDYFWKTKKRPPKTKPRAKPLPKAKEAYLEAEETLFQELEEHSIGYERKFQFEPTKHWRFDFHIVKLRLLIEIAGGHHLHAWQKSVWSWANVKRSCLIKADGRKLDKNNRCATGLAVYLFISSPLMRVTVKTQQTVSSAV